jgi:hypothetical protein
VHVARADGDALARLHLEVGAVQVEEDPAALEIEGLHLPLVLLQREGVPLRHLQHLPRVAILVGVPDLATPGLGDDLRLEKGEAVLRSIISVMVELGWYLQYGRAQGTGARGAAPGETPRSAVAGQPTVRARSYD